MRPRSRFGRLTCVLELYDVRADIGEKNNVAAQHPDVAKKMAAILEKAYTPPRRQREPPKPKGKRHA